MEAIHKCMEDYPMLCGAVVTAIVLILIYYVLLKEGFIGFQAAPIAAQRPSGLLGVGGPLRFSSEFSSTNQGRANLVNQSLNRTEHMTGHVEMPVTQSVMPVVNNYQQNQAKTPVSSESFSARGLYADYFKNDVDSRLKSVLHGGN